MANLNKVFLMGNLTRDPELRYIPSGSAVASFGLAIGRKYKQGDTAKEDVCFVDITVWEKQAENCSKYLKKGSGVLIEGRLNYRTWETEEGQKRSKLDVVATNIQFLPKGGSQDRIEDVSNEVSEPAVSGNFDNSKNKIMDDDIPF